MKQTVTGAPYRDEEILLATMHHKEEAIAPSFQELLGAKIEVASIDTDQFGTFSGEVARKDRADRVARAKCLKALEETASPFALASEGSFGPHPHIPFSSCGHEILYFIDKRHDIEVMEQLITPRTNFNKLSISTFAQLEAFAVAASFPSHALILKKGPLLVKGIDSTDALKHAFKELSTSPLTEEIEVETDMRAHHNPTRMEAIGQLALKLAQRLATLCPICSVPGYGMVEHLKGLPCSRCGCPTERVIHEIHRCAKCPHEEKRPRQDGLEHADPAECPYCNP